MNMALNDDDDDHDYVLNDGNGNDNGPAVFERDEQRSGQWCLLLSTVAGSLPCEHVA